MFSLHLQPKSLSGEKIGPSILKKVLVEVGPHAKCPDFNTIFIVVLLRMHSNVKSRWSSVRNLDDWWGKNSVQTLVLNGQKAFGIFFVGFLTIKCFIIFATLGSLCANCNVWMWLFELRFVKGQFLLADGSIVKSNKLFFMFILQSRDATNKNRVYKVLAVYNWI